MPFILESNSCLLHSYKTKFILFDLDGTLVDSAADLYRAMNLSLEKLALPLVTEVQIRAWVGKVQQNYVRLSWSIYLGRLILSSKSNCLILCGRFMNKIMCKHQVYEVFWPFWITKHKIDGCVTNKPRAFSKNPRYFKVIIF